MNKDEALQYIRQASLILLAAVSLIFPAFFLTNTTEIFIFPKQLLIIAAGILLLILFSLKTIVEGKITVRASPFNLPIVILVVVVLASSFLSRSMYDSLLQSAPLLMLCALFFVTINTIHDKASLKIVELSLLGGALLSSFITILQFLKIYIFPITVTQNQFFNTHGSIIQQLIYLVPLLVLSSYHLFRMSKMGKLDYDFGFYAFSSLVMAVGFIVIAYQIITLPEKPILLPIQYGFQIALASISQDSPRLAQAFLLGSGYGTYAQAFSRFKPAAFNGESDLWNLVFSYSSNYFLELVATVGLLGTLAYLFLTVKVFRTKLSKMNGLYAGLLITLLLSFILPFSYVSLFLLVMLLGLYACYLYINKHDEVYDFTLSLIAWKQSLINFTMPSDDKEANVTPSVEKKESKYLPVGMTLLILLIVGFIGYMSTRYVLADNKFKDSLSAENLNNGQKTYDLQRAAIGDFPYKSDYYRVFSQINLALANSILTNLPPNSSPSAETQQTVLGLLQQSINASRASASLAPVNSSNWVQLSQVYRNLIGVGQNAESFAVASLQQAIQLDPYNPNLYIQLGGIYYQLGLYEQAQNQFQIATNLKPDLANAHYNLGHALEAKGDLQGAFNQYNIVKGLVKDNPENDKQISAEIEALRTKAGKEQAAAPQASETDLPAGRQEQGPLELSRPEVTLPPRNPQIKLSPPPATITPSPSPSGTVTPSPSVTPAEQ